MFNKLQFLINEKLCQKIKLKINFKNLDLIKQQNNFKKNPKSSNH